jgi:hypothetical protein
MMAEPAKPVMSCEELLKALNDYVDDETVVAVCREFAEHLAGCNPCQVVVDNIRKTIRLYKNGEPFPIPPECADRLRAALEAKWRDSFPAPSG